jgi:choline-sulfatase
LKTIESAASLSNHPMQRLLTALTLFVAQPLSFAAQTLERLPNIVFILADDQRDDSLGCEGHPVLRTPAIDSLADTGVLFENSFVTTPICWVSRAATLTGRTVRAHGQPTRIETVRSEVANEMYPALLRNAGYRTAHFGKWHARMPEGFERSTHFDEFRSITGHPFFRKQSDGSLRHETQLIGDEALRFLEQAQPDQPFMMQLWFSAPHAQDANKSPGMGHFPWPKSVPDDLYEDKSIAAPRLNDPELYEKHPDFLKRSINRARFHWRWDTPEKYETNMRAYFRMISGIDLAVARVREKLAALGLADNTVIIYSADNGYYLGDRGFAGKWTHYEESLRVPLIIHDPRSKPSARGTRSDALVLNVDIAATLLDLAGAEVPATYQGRSLLPFVRAERPADWREQFFVEHVSVPPLLTWEGVRGSRYVYARYFDVLPPFEFLHDLERDPDQLQNLASSEKHQAVLRDMRERCQERVMAYGGPLLPMSERYGRTIRTSEEERSAGPLQPTSQEK